MEVCQRERPDAETPASRLIEPTKNGDLLIMPKGFHNEGGGAFWHSVEKQPGKPCLTRYSLTWRNPDLSPEGPWTKCKIHNGFNNPCDACRDEAKEGAPFTYETDFLTPKETEAVLKECEKLPRERSATHWGNKRRNVIGQSFSDVKSKRLAYVTKGLHPLPIADAPPAIRNMIAKLQDRVQLSHPGQNRQVNYVSLVIYENEKDHMGWHQHKEDKGHDTPVLIVSLGAERTFGIRRKGAKQHYTFTPKSGSLIILSTYANISHEHAVLDDKEPKGIRYAFNCKCVDEVYGWKPEPESNKEPHVYSCKKGQPTPPSGVIYVGCKTVRGQKWDGSIFGNAENPLKVRHKKKNPWAAGGKNWSDANNKAAFRSYMLEKIKDDPKFREELRKLRGKDLLCWCIQEGKHKAGFCHARVVRDLANGPECEEPIISRPNPPPADGQRPLPGFGVIPGFGPQRPTQIPETKPTTGQRATNLYVKVS